MALAKDRAQVDFATYAPDQIGRTRYLTPEGFMVCEGVRIARTGPMMYAPKEMPDIEQGPYTSMITVLRDAEVLFHPDTIRSFAGKPVTNDHPPEPVTPKNYKLYSVGTVMDPRRGEGAESEYLIADLIIEDEQAIADIDAGKIEISAGYDVDVEQIKPGVARQTKNLGNHVALVDRARGGPALSIQDEEPTMATRTTRKIIDGIRRAFKAKDEAALEENLSKAEEAMDEEEEEGSEAHRVVIEVKGPAAAAEGESTDEGAAGEGGGDEEAPAWFKAHAEKSDARFGALEEAVKKLAGSEQEETHEEAGDEDPEAKEEEGEAEKAQAQDAMSKAEILVPGIKLPALDGAKVKRADLTAARRTTLKTALADSGRKVHVEGVLAGRDVEKLKPREVAMAFDAAAAIAKASNNAAAHARGTGAPTGPMTPRKLQERIRERRKEHYGAN